MICSLRLQHVLFGMVALFCVLAGTEATNGADKADRDRVLAIDVVLLPDAKMLAAAKEANAKLRSNYPKGYSLGEEQAAHISLLHCYVNEKDLEKVEAAVTKVAERERPLDQELMATGYGSGMWDGLAITFIDQEKSPQLMRFGNEIVEAVKPFIVKTGSKEAFHKSRELPTIEDKIVTYVEKFTTNSAGKNYNPHVTVGVAREDFVKQLKAEPFEKFPFKASKVAIYQLGSFGTCQKKLWEWPSK